MIKINFEKFFEIGICLYIIGIFCFQRPVTVLIWRIIQIVYFGILFIMIIKKNHKLDFYFYWQLIFISICLISSLINFQSNLDILITLFKNFIAGYGVYLYCENENSISRIFNFFIIANVMLILIIMNTVDISTLGLTRLGLGEEMLLNGFQANELGSFFVIAFISSLYMRVNSEKKIYTVITIVFLLFVFLTGSKKALMIVIICSFIQLVFIDKSILKKIKNFLFFIFCLLLLISIVVNNTEIYNIIGVRFLSFFEALSGGGSTTHTDVVRFSMIEKGIEWFYFRPIFGSGLGSYSVLWGNYSGTPTYSHNNYIELLVSIGVTGTIVYYSIYIYSFIRLIKKFKYFNQVLSVCLISFLLFLIISDLGVVSYDYAIYQIILAVIAAYTGFRKEVY